MPETVLVPVDTFGPSLGIETLNLPMSPRGVSVATDHLSSRPAPRFRPARHRRHRHPTGRAAMTLDRMAPLEPVIGVIGTGYLGTTHAACRAEPGVAYMCQDQI